MFYNTDVFNEEARHFLKTGVYTSSIPGTFAFKEYWQEQLRRCIEGYSIGNLKITGQHYGYLNFCQIRLTSDTDTTSKKKGRKKIMSFPRFYDTDFEYFWELERAREEGQGMIVAKSRRKGFSYKNAWLVTHQFGFIRDSICIVGAYLDDYADNTIGMTIDNLNFLNKNTAFKRQRNPDRRDFMKAQFKETLSDGTEIWEGYKSEIHKLTFKDDAFKSIGKTANLMLFEEAGKWLNLKATYQFSEPTWMDGEFVVGMPIIFGTGGDMEGGTADFADMFYHPETYNLRAFNNIWDDTATKKCGYFVPDYKIRPGFIDEHGNSDEKGAKTKEEEKRKIIAETSRSSSDLDARISQYPFTPKEAFRRRQGNIFPTELLQDQLSYIETHKEASDMAQVGTLKWDNGQVTWKPSETLKAISHFPVAEGDDIAGAITIWEQPEVDPNSKTIPYGLYIAGTDPYDMDEAITSPSLGSTFIYKRMTSMDKTYHWPVAEYTGRPDSAEEYYENVRKLLTYYNATNLYENEKKGIFQYFQTKYCTHLLADQPTEMIKEIIKNSVVQRGKGVHMVTGIKGYCEILLRDWLKEEYAPGRRNLNKIYSVPLLEELINYNRDEGNFDRAIAFMLCILYNLSLFRIPEIQAEKIASLDSFFTRPLFARN